MNMQKSALLFLLLAWSFFFNVFAQENVRTTAKFNGGWSFHAGERKLLKADGEDLSFVTVKVVDKNGILVPDANTLVNFTLKGEAQMAGVDDGDPVSHEPFKATYRKTFHGLAMAIIQIKNKAGKITLQATSPGLQASYIIIESKL